MDQLLAYHVYSSWLLFCQLAVFVHRSFFFLLPCKELLLLGSIGHKWSSLIEKLMSSNYESLTISKVYQEVQNFLSRRLQSLSSEDDMFPEVFLTIPDDIVLTLLICWCLILHAFIVFYILTMVAVLMKETVSINNF